AQSRRRRDTRDRSLSDIVPKRRRRIHTRGRVAALLWLRRGAAGIRRGCSEGPIVRDGGLGDFDELVPPDLGTAERERAGSGNSGRAERGEARRKNRARAGVHFGNRRLL